MKRKKKVGQRNSETNNNPNASQIIIQKKNDRTQFLFHPICVISRGLIKVMHTQKLSNNFITKKKEIEKSKKPNKIRESKIKQDAGRKT